jgi:DNA processing protein
MAAMEVALGSQARAWTTLALACGLSARRALALADAFGGAEAVVRADPARLAAHRVGAETAGAIATARDGLADLLRSLEHDGVSIVTWADGDYPSRLREIPDPPLALFVRGEVADLDRPAVAIVGARRASGYGRRVAEELGRDLAGAGLVVVSGLAAGIDAAAHRGALAAGGRTVAVLGTGIDRVYPPWHRDLADEISGSGALVTEFGPGEPPRPGHFPQRNRTPRRFLEPTCAVANSPSARRRVRRGAQSPGYSCQSSEPRGSFPRSVQRGPHRPGTESVPDGDRRRCCR